MKLFDEIAKMAMENLVAIANTTVPVVVALTTHPVGQVILCVMCDI